MSSRHASAHDVLYRLAAALAVTGSLSLIWLAMGVGIIGADGDPANRLYAIVIAVGVAGVIGSGRRTRGLARTMFAMAAAQSAIAAYAIAAGLGSPFSPPLELLVLNGAFVTIFAGAGALFLRVSKVEPLRIEPGSSDSPR